MHHKAYIWLVYAHTKSDGGHHNDFVFAQETGLVFVANLRGQAGMIGQGVEALLL